MDLSAFRSLNIFTWRPSLSDTHSNTRLASEQTQDTNTQTTTSDERSRREERAEATNAQTRASDSLEGSPVANANEHPGVPDILQRNKDPFNWPQRDFANIDQPTSPYHRHPYVTPIDPVEKIEGMYRLLDLIGESGSNGYVDKVIIAQDSIQRFVNSVSPGAYASVTKVDFKALDRFLIRPLGVYGSKSEIVRLLRSIAVIDDDMARLLLAPTGGSDSPPTLSSGLYIMRTNTLDVVDERHYVIYWPEDTTWDDSATSSVRRNRVHFMRYLTKICDQVVALLSPEHSTAIVWGDQDSDTESVDVEAGDSDRLFTFEVAETNEQEENAAARPGFLMNSRHIVPYKCPPDCPIDPAVLSPRLLPGETTQGFWTASYIPRQTRSEAFDELTFSKVSLKQLLMDNSIVLSEELEEKAVQTLIHVGLEDLSPELCDKWRITKLDIHARYRQEFMKRRDTVCQDIAKGEDSLRSVLREVVVEDVMKLFPSLQHDEISVAVEDSAGPNAGQEATVAMRLSDFESLYPGFRAIYQKYFDNARFDTTLRLDARFDSQKLRLLSIRYLLEKNQHLGSEARADLIRTVIFEGDFRRAQQMLPRADEKKRSGPSGWAGRALFSASSSSEGSLEREMKALAARVPDAHFLLMMKSEADEELRPVIEEVLDLAYAQLNVSIDAVVKTMIRALSAMQLEYCEKAIRHEMETEETKSQNKVLFEFIQDINARALGRQDSVVYIDGVITTQSIGSRDTPLHYDRSNAGRSRYSSSYQGYSHRYSQEYVITGRRQALQEPKIEIWVHLMNLTSDDRHNMQLDSDYIPSPTVNDRLSSGFHIPTTLNIAFYRLLESEKILLILLDRDRVIIYLDRLPAINVAIRGDRHIKSLSREKLGEDVLFAFDEVKRSLVVCAPSKLQLHLFIFDESYRTLQAQGGAINLAPWYSQTELSILHAAFVCGNEEIVLVDSTAQVRIFSFVTLQFRPASLQLPSLPTSIFSSPDGSCLLVHTQGPTPLLTAYHWETFGSSAGIDLEVPDFPLQSAVLTSMVDRGRVFLTGLDVNSGCVQSIAIDITKKLTEFMFKEHGNKNASNNRTRHTVHNSLLDCHAEVWSRFPVVAAVKRRTVTSSERRQKSITFIAENHSQPFGSYFSDLIQTFERTTRKPTGDELRRIRVSAKDFTSFRNEAIMDSDRDVSRYRVGEWLVNLLCLIPIHIAVCRENRFVPLADGVLSSDLERSLLGAEVSKIVDKLSFGWYESIFQSYLATKPVKVVSSMGQQSVGKSFALNHLLDTSFAGSAMRTTEGVWMSVTPTDDALIVALDFEGVDSVERSLQEDTLLVLFNTAISNLVLFRNNFAFSRDISGLFQSFQSSASVLDPAANPTLFQSTLVIIIKDVVVADKVEITREFSLKFQKIVQQEQRANFISRLHRGKLDIIPWPVIESKEFYKLFSTLKKRLDSQKTSHTTAGEFLFTIKTLMAKLKANDWGALSQTMIDHRARTLFALLPIALSTGFSEIEPDLEPLKNLDTDAIVEGEDTPTRFAISEREPLSSADIEMHLSILRELWNRQTPRQSMSDPEWTSKFASYIGGLIDMRVSHVRLWLDSNLERFQAGHAAVEDLRRRFDNMVIEMRTNAQLCRAQCASCHLLCIHSRLHEGDHSCETTHKCEHNCAFCKDQPKACGIPAGHPGEHVCVVNAHLCGGPCKLSGKRGCLQDCTKTVGHAEDEHMCSALVHMCGEPCALQGMPLPGERTYSCQEGCSMPSDQPHDVHSCDMRLCPVTCDLCRRLCIQSHLHGLTTGSSHLCGESHPCSALCSAPGICQIDTTPLSIEATFTGRHETFQYTKYSQVAKRLQCVKNIEPGQTLHTGAHIHTKEGQPFHFCETRCKNCGYFCTFPLGHTQQEHETSHGSMTQTRWAIDGPDETDIELGGRKFSANDDGAPMMCNLVCSSMGRHVHIDYCRAGANVPCEGAELQHINARMIPSPDKPKDAVTHNLYWRRMGFKDPYTRDEQAIFGKCDAMCSGPEHSATGSGSGQPSYCTLPMFHPLRRLDEPVTGHGYISNDGHMFDCRNPVIIQQAFHVIFVIDRSGSMCSTDRQPLVDGPAAERIRESADNRLGAVYSALYSFWTARHVAATAGQQLGTRRGIDAVYSALYNLWSTGPATATVEQPPGHGRRDAYSVVLFSDIAKTVLTNDFTSNPNQLLDILLGEQAGGGTNFATALRTAQSVMLQHWNTERAPIMIFLSDGECVVSDRAIQEVCQSAVEKGKPLSFHSVSFGEDASATTLRKMADLALEVQNNAPGNALLPAAANIPSSFATALDTVRLTETFLGIAESLRKPRGSLIH